MTPLSPIRNYYGRCTNDREDIGRCVNTATHHFIRYTVNDFAVSPIEDEAFVCDQHMMGDGKDNRRDYGWVEISLPASSSDADTTMHIIRQISRIRRAEERIMTEPVGSVAHETAWQLLFDLIRCTPYEEIREAAKSAIRQLFTVGGDR